MTIKLSYARIDSLTLYKVIWGDRMQKVNRWKWATLGMGVLLLLGFGLHLNALDRAHQDYLVKRQEIESWVAIQIYCDGLKYQMLEGQMKRRMYAPFPEDDAAKCKARIPGFDPEIPNYVGQ